MPSVTSKPDTLRALEIQTRVIRAFILREMKTRYGKHKLGFFWAFVEPLMFIGMFAGLYWLLDRSAPNGMPMLSFLLTGCLGFLLFRNTLAQTMNGVNANKALLTFPQVTVFDLVLARVILEFVVALVVFVTLTGVSVLIREPVRIETPIGLLGVLLSYSLIAMGLGSGFCVISQLFPSTQQVVSVALGRPLFFTSGLFFTADMLPYEVREILLWNPLLHLTEMMRSFYFVQFESIHSSQSYVVYFVMGTLAWGLLMLSAFRRTLHST